MTDLSLDCMLTSNSVLELFQLCLEVWCFETLPDSHSILENLTGIVYIELNSGGL